MVDRLASLPNAIFLHQGAEDRHNGGNNEHGTDGGGGLGDGCVLAALGRVVEGNEGIGHIDDGGDVHAGGHVGGGGVGVGAVAGGGRGREGGTLRQEGGQAEDIGPTEGLGCVGYMEEGGCLVSKVMNKDIPLARTWMSRVGGVGSVHSALLHNLAQTQLKKKLSEFHMTGKRQKRRGKEQRARR